MPTTTGAPTLRPPPCLTTPPSIVTPVDIRLPTQPLDISCVKDIAVSAAPPPLPIPSEMKGEPCNAENSSKTVNVLRNVRSKSSSKDLHASIGVPHGIKKQFVRPFEDDYNTTDYALKHEDSEHIKPEEEEESSPAIVSSLEASFKNNNNNVIRDFLEETTLHELMVLTGQNSCHLIMTDWSQSSGADQLIGWRSPGL